MKLFQPCSSTLLSTNCEEKVGKQRRARVKAGQKKGFQKVEFTLYDSSGRRVGLKGNSEKAHIDEVGG